MIYYRNMKRLLLLTIGLLTLGAQAGEWRPKERWRGFNLPGLAIKGSFEGQVAESDFEMIAELGFNFVRLPIDYRYFCQESDAMQPDAEKFPRLDKIIGWGRKHGIHVNLAYATFPGMQLKPRSKGPLFKDPEVRRHLAENWRFIARRYRGVPNEELTFNLFNEPDSTAIAAIYKETVEMCLRAIHEEDPERFVIIDGYRCGRGSVPELYATEVGQSLHAYEPSGLTHYRANWVNGNDLAPKPVWPPSLVVSPMRGKSHAPIVNGEVVIRDLPACVFAIEAGLLKREAEIIVKADDQEILRYYLAPSPDAPGWTNCQVRVDGRYAAVPLKPIECLVPACKRFSVTMGKGEWMDVVAWTFTSLDGKTLRVEAQQSWPASERDRDELRFMGFDQPLALASGHSWTGADYLQRETWNDWDRLRAVGRFMMVGEFGVLNTVDHATTLAWMEDNLKEWKKRDLGWAMWNFRGSMGIIDSGRKDAEYVDFHGHRLDRKMYELLKRY